MPKPSRKTPQRVARMIALHQTGASAREIADELECNHGTILSWLDDAGLRANGGQGSRKARSREALDGAEAVMAEEQKKLAELTGAPAPSNFAGVLERLRDAFGLASGLVEFHMAAAREGKSTMVELEKATRLQDYYATRIRELTPREPENPANDPSNLEAAAEVRRKLAALVEKAEGAAVCRMCGHNPHGKSAPYEADR